MEVRFTHVSTMHIGKIYQSAFEKLKLFFNTAKLMGDDFICLISGRSSGIFGGPTGDAARVDRGCGCCDVHVCIGGPDAALSAMVCHLLLASQLHLHIHSYGPFLK